MSYQFELEKGSTKHICPACRKKVFVRYVDTETGQYIADDVGRCDREIKCSYHLKPGEYFHLTGENPLRKRLLRNDLLTRSIKVPDEKPVYVPDVLFRGSLQHYEENMFFRYLVQLFGTDKAEELCAWYCVGTTKHWDGACVFWYLDDSGRVTRGKVMLYDNTGHRVKGCTNSVHSLMKLGALPELHLYGLHLLRLDKTLPVAIVESEKSAILAAGHLKDFIWMATGSLSTLTAERLQPLQGREIVLFPDGGAFEKWQEKAESMSRKFSIRCSDVLERCLSDEQRKVGYDIGDVIANECSAFRNKIAQLD
ncbi:MAG: DUF6371 domain-containing protein [Chlorobiales bacterium]|nr:DUF6371 domain-containing protein [Chlorobiales bacterium]